MAMPRFRRIIWVACALVGTSTSALASAPLRIVSEGKAGKDWVQAAQAPLPAYPPGAEDVGGVCVNIGYYLGADGTPSDFAVIKAWSRAVPEASQQDLFSKTAIASLMRTRFVPANAGRPRPMYTSSTFVFAGSDGDPAGLRERCEVTNLAGFIAQAQKDSDLASWHEIKWNSDWFHAKNTRIHGLNRE